jgi:carbamate kinase
MKGSYVVLVEGEVLLNQRERTFEQQYQNASMLADGLSSIIAEDSRIVLICDNRPHIGYLLYRSALSSHILHPIPIDVAIGDSQGAIGYVLTRALNNSITRHGLNRRVTNIITNALVEEDHDPEQTPLRTIGPYFDRERALRHQQTEGWTIVEEPGHGYRRAIHCLPPLEIIEMDEIRELVDRGNIVIAGSGGGVALFRRENGELIGAEELVEVESTATLIAKNINAAYLLIIVESNAGFLASGLFLDPRNEMSMSDLEHLLAQGKISTDSERSKLNAAVRFLQSGGLEVIITTSKKLGEAVAGESGLTIR